MTDRPPDPMVAIERGLAVFPLPPGSNFPDYRGWQKGATTNPDQVRRWWRPGDNIGIGCWRSRVVGLDLDVAVERYAVSGVETLASQCAAHGQPWPDTLTITTPSGGRHLYFRVPAGHTVLSSSGGRSGLGPGVDVRGPGRGGRGGYLVGPDSLVNGRRYTVTNDTPIADLPAWMTHLLNPHIVSLAPTDSASGVPHTRGRRAVSVPINRYYEDGIEGAVAAVATNDGNSVVSLVPSSGGWNPALSRKRGRRHQAMGWISPRKAEEHATQMGERWAKDYEKQLGRSLNADELRQVHEQARDTATKWGEDTRK